MVTRVILYCNARLRCPSPNSIVNSTRAEMVSCHHCKARARCVEKVRWGLDARNVIKHSNTKNTENAGCHIQNLIFLMHQWVDEEVRMCTGQILSAIQVVKQSSGISSHTGLWLNPMALSPSQQGPPKRGSLIRDSPHA